MCLCDISVYLSPLLLFSCQVVCNSLRPHGLQHARLPCPSPSPRACSKSCPLSQWRHPTISSSVVPFSSCFPLFAASESFPGLLYHAGKVLELQHQSFHWIFRVAFSLDLTILICYPPTSLPDLCIYVSVYLIYYLSAYLSSYLVGK